MPRITISLTDAEYGDLTGLAAEERRPIPWQAAKLIADGLAIALRSVTDPAAALDAQRWQEIERQAKTPQFPPPRQNGTRDPGPASAKDIGRQHARMTPLVIEDESGLPPPDIRGTAPGVTVDPKAAELFRITEETLAESAGR